MKKLYGLIGLTGFILMIGAAGGAEGTSFGVTVLIMLAGLAMLAASQLLIKIHDYRARLRRRMAARVSSGNVCRTRVPAANTVRARKINSLELC